VDSDVIVLGGGVAGLAAARRLVGAGLRVLLVEGRRRLGGRIETVREPPWPIPVELGAEFVHGRAPAILREHLRLGAVPERHLLSRGAALVGGEHAFAEAQRLLDDGAAGDRSFKERLAAAQASTEAKRLAALFVEGFHAAPIELASSRAIGEQHRADARLGGGTARPLDGYRALVERLAASLGAVELRLGTVAEALEWRPGAVRVIVRGPLGGLRELRARAAVIALPLAVLKRAFRISPPVPQARAIERLAVGAVVKVVLWFRHAFWPSDLVFVHARHARVPTWWTPRPFHAPILVGWAAGPAADGLSFHPPSEILDRALWSLRRIFRRRRRELYELLAGAYVRDWQADPLARGAYSYVPVGALDAQRALAEPVSSTLYFAGEATHAGGASATVHGALETGERAADQLLARLGGGAELTL
jgi:monoamine oxidase